MTDLSEGAVSRFVRDSVAYVPAVLVPAIFSLLAVTAFTRIFDPVEYGVYSLVLAVIGPMLDLVTEPVAQPAARFYAEYQREGRSPEYRTVIARLVLSAMVIAVAIATITGVGLVIVRGQIPYPLIFAGATVLATIQVAMFAIMPILRASLRPQEFTISTITSAGLFVGISLVLVLVVSKDVAWLLWGQAASLLVMFPYVYRRADISLAAGLHRLTPAMRSTAKRFMRYGLPMMGWYAAANILHREDLYVIGAFRGTEEVGIYSVNYGLVFAVSNLLTVPIMFAVGPVLYHQWGNRQVHQAQRTISYMSELYLMLALAFIGGVVALGPAVVTVVLGSDYHAGASILIPVALGRVLWGVAAIGHKGLELREQPLIIAGSALAAAAVNLGLNLLFVPVYGYIAAAYVTMISYASYCVLIWWQCRSRIPWSIDLGSSSRYLVPAVAATAFIIAVNQVPIDIAPSIRLLVDIALFVLLYGTLTAWVAGHRIRQLVIPETQI